MLTDAYQNTAKKLMFKIKNQPRTDLDRALDELEYLMTIENFDHLKPTQINLVDYYNIDVYAFLLAVFTVLILNTWLICKAIFFTKKLKTD